MPTIFSCFRWGLELDYYISLCMSWSFILFHDRSSISSSPFYIILIRWSMLSLFSSLLFKIRVFSLSVLSSISLDSCYNPLWFSEDGLSTFSLFLDRSTRIRLDWSILFNNWNSPWLVMLLFLQYSWVMLRLLINSWFSSVILRSPSC